MFPPPSNATNSTSSFIQEQSESAQKEPADGQHLAAGKMQSETIENGSEALWKVTNGQRSADPYLPNLLMENKNGSTNSGQAEIRTVSGKSGLSAYKNQPEAVARLNDETAKQYTHELYEAINSEKSDKDKIKNLLGSLDSADRKAIEEAYVNTSGNTDHRDIRTELKDNLDEEDYSKAEAQLNKRDGQTNDAGNLMVSLCAIRDNRGDAERRVLESFATLNAEQQSEMQADFEKDYGKSIDQALKDFGLSGDALKAVGFVRKPVEERSAQDIEEFARFAIEKGNLDYFGIALRGETPAAIEARKDLCKREDFKKEIAEAFKVHQDGGSLGTIKNFVSAIPGGDILVGGFNLVEGLVKGDLDLDRLTEGTNFDKLRKAVEGKEVDSKLLQAMDILRNGQVSLATIAADNTGTIFGWFDNKDAISNAAEHATEREKRMFAHGQELAKAGSEGHSEEDKNALAFYKSVHDAFANAGNGNEPKKWEDRLLNGKDGSVISQILDNESKEGRFSAIEKLSQKDWEKLKDPAAGAAFRKQIEEELTAEGKKEEAQVLKKLLDEKLAASSYEESQKFLRSVSDLITMPADGKTAVATIAGLRPGEAARYQTDSAFRGQVDQFVNSKLEGLGKVAASRLLFEVAATGRVPLPDAIDKVFSDKLNDVSGKDAIGDIEKALQDGALRKKLAGPESSLSDEERQLKKTVAEYIESAGEGTQVRAYGRGAALVQQKDDEYLQTLLQTGRLTVEQKAKLKLRDVGFFGEAAKVTAEERERLYDSGLLSADEKQLIDTLTQGQGEMSLADQLRLSVIQGVSNDNAFTDKLSGLSSIEKQNLKDEYSKKYGSCLDEDVLAQAGAEAKNDFRRYLTASEVDGRQDYYDNLEQALHSESGYSPNGSKEVLERSLSNQAAMLSDFQARFEKLPPEKQAEANQLFAEAVRDYKESKEKFAEKMYQAAVIVGGVAVGVATGGVGLAALASVAVLGAAGRIALKKGIQGNDYEVSLSNCLKDGAIGSATAGLSVLGPETFAAFAQVGKVAAGRFTKAAGEELEKAVLQKGADQTGFQTGKNILQSVLKKDAVATMEKQINNVVSHSIVRGEPITGQTIDNIVEKIIVQGATQEEKAALSCALRATLEASGREVTEGVIKNSLTGMVRQSAAFGVLGGTANVAIEGTVGLANGHFDPNNLPQSFLVGFGLGSGMSLGLETAVRGAGKYVSGASKDADSPVTGNEEVPTDAAGLAAQKASVSKEASETSIADKPAVMEEESGIVPIDAGKTSPLKDVEFVFSSNSEATIDATKLAALKAKLLKDIAENGIYSGKENPFQSEQKTHFQKKTSYENLHESGNYGLTNNLIFENSDYFLGPGESLSIAKGLDHSFSSFGKKTSYIGDDHSFDYPNFPEEVAQKHFLESNPVSKSGTDAKFEVIEPTVLAKDMAKLPNSAEFRDLVGDRTVGSVPLEFLSGGLTEAQAITKLNNLANMLRQLDGTLPKAKKSGAGTTELNMGEFEVPFGKKNAVVEKIGIGEVAHVYKISIDGKEVAFKVPTDPARTDVHGVFAETGAYTFLSKYKIKDLTNFYSANLANGWMMTEFLSKPMTREGEVLKDVLKEHGLRLADDWAANRGPGNVAWDIGGIEPINALNPVTLDQFKTAMQDPNFRMVAGRRAGLLWDQNERKEALLLALECPEAAGQVARSAARNFEHFNKEQYESMFELLTKALEKPGAAGRAAFELDEIAHDERALQLFLRAFENPEARIEAAKHIDKLRPEYRFLAYEKAFEYPECREMATRCISSIQNSIEQEAALDLANAYPGTRYVLLKTQPALADGKALLQKHLAAHGLIEPLSLKAEISDGKGLDWSELTHISNADLAARVLNGPLIRSSLPKLVGPVQFSNVHSGYFSNFSDQDFGQGIVAIHASGRISVTPNYGYGCKYIPVKDANGNPGYEKRQTFSAGTLTETVDGAKHYQFRDGNKLIESNGHFHLTSKSGEVYPFWHLADETTNADGSKFITHGDGTIEKIDRNGTRVTHYPNDAEVTVYPDNTLEIHRPDGSAEIHYPDGTFEKVNSDQSFQVRTAGGKDLDRAAEGKVTLRDHAAEVNQYVGGLSSKLNRDHVSSAEIQALIHQFEPSDQALAASFVEAGLSNINDRMLIDSLRSIRKNIYKESNHNTWLSHLISPERGGLSDVEAYLFRKANKADGSINDMSRLKTGTSTDKQFIVFGDLSKLSESQRDLIKDALAEGKSIVNINVNLDKGLNFIDFATGNAAAKLRALVEEAKRLPKGELQANPDRWAAEVLTGEGKRVAAELNIQSHSPEPISLDEAAKPNVSEEQIHEYLSQHYPDIRLRSKAAALLDGTLDYVSFKSLASKSKDLHDLILQDLGEKAIRKAEGESALHAASYDEIMEAGKKSEKNAFYIVGDSSDAMISTVYRKANNLPDQFITLKEFEHLRERGMTNDAQFIYLDDTAYSGDQLRNFINTSLRKLKTKAIVGNFGSYRGFGEKSWSNPDAAADLISLAGHTGINKFVKSWSELDHLQDAGTRRTSREGLNAIEAEDFLEKTARGDGSYQDIDSFQIFPSMVSDTSVSFVKEFAQGVLGMHVPFNTQSAPFKIKSDPLAEFSKFKWAPPVDLSKINGRVQEPDALTSAATPTTEKEGYGYNDNWF